MDVIDIEKTCTCQCLDDSLFLIASFARRAIVREEFITCRTEIAFPFHLREIAEPALFVAKVDHIVGFMVGAVSPSLSWNSVDRVLLARGMCASFIFYVDHILEFMDDTVRRSLATDIVDWKFLTRGVYAPFIHDVDHILELVDGAMRRSPATDAVVSVLLAHEMHASFCHDIDRILEFMD